MDPIIHLRDLVPDPEDVLALEPEELAGLLLRAFHLSGHAQFSRLNMMLAFTQGAFVPYPPPFCHQLPAVIAEAWAWLENHGLLITKPTDPHWQVLSRQAAGIQTEEAFAVFRGANAFPRQLLHPTIEKEAWPSFSRGRFDTAVFEAFREVEIAVREAAGFAPSEHGVPMIRRAFHKDSGPLTDQTVDDAEKEATSALFAGAIGIYKNPGSHRHVGRDDVAEAGELLILASHLLRVIDQRKSQAARPKPPSPDRSDA